MLLFFSIDRLQLPPRLAADLLCEYVPLLRLLTFACKCNLIAASNCSSLTALQLLRHAVLQIEKRFPDKDNAKILIGCSNGRKYSMDALMALDEAGYVNIVGLKGGYYAWNRCDSGQACLSASLIICMLVRMLPNFNGSHSHADGIGLLYSRLLNGDQLSFNHNRTVAKRNAVSGLSSKPDCQHQDAAETRC